MVMSSLLCMLNIPRYYCQQHHVASIQYILTTQLISGFHHRSFYTRILLRVCTVLKISYTCLRQLSLCAVPHFDGSKVQCRYRIQELSKQYFPYHKTEDAILWADFDNVLDSYKALLQTKTEGINT